MKKSGDQYWVLVQEGSDSGTYYFTIMAGRKIIYKDSFMWDSIDKADYRGALWLRQKLELGKLDGRY
jgi:hypothetical protein